MVTDDDVTSPSTSLVVCGSETRSEPSAPTVFVSSVTTSTDLAAVAVASDRVASMPTATPISGVDGVTTDDVAVTDDVVSVIALETSVVIDDCVAVPSPTTPTVAVETRSDAVATPVLDDAVRSAVGLTGDAVAVPTDDALALDVTPSDCTDDATADSVRDVAVCPVAADA